MEAYTDFAEVYDTFMDETPYEAWAERIAGLIEKYGISKPLKGKAEDALSSERNLVLDMGCGTGTLTELLSGMGYDMIGIDSSEEMLRIAVEKKEKSNSPILYLCQDMRDLDLYSTVGTVISVCDSVNYLLEEEEIEEVFALVENYLYPGGIFLFDFNTVYKYAEVIGDATIAENREECSFIWENYYHDTEHINEYDLTVFVKEKEGLFRRFEETHYQRGYTLEEMEGFLRKAGFQILCTMDGDTGEAVRKESERIDIVAKKVRTGSEPERE
jgi:SAM-dependent methyltransferase